MDMSEKEFYNSHKILAILKEITNYRIWKDEIFDCWLRKTVFVYYLKLEQNNIPINEEQFLKLKEFGVKEIIV